MISTLTDTTRSRSRRAVGGSSASDPGVDAPLDPARLDAAFAVIGRFLPGSDATTEHLPSDAGTAACLTALAEEFGADGLRTIHASTSIDPRRRRNAASEPRPRSSRPRPGCPVADPRRSAAWAGKAPPASPPARRRHGRPGRPGRERGKGTAGLAGLCRWSVAGRTPRRRRLDVGSRVPGRRAVDRRDRGALVVAGGGRVDDDPPEASHRRRPPGRRPRRPPWLAAARERVVGTMEHGS